MTLAETPTTDAPTGLWPTWDSRADGYAALARFVSTESLMYTAIRGADQGVRDGQTLEDGDVEVARERFESLRALELHYGFEPYLGLLSERQQIRHPEWVCSVESGTCLDLAITYASMCRDAHVAALLAIDDQHAWIVLRPGAYAVDSAWVADAAGNLAVPGTESEERGVWRVRDAAALQAAVDVDDFVAVDCVAATEPRVTFAQAKERGRRFLSPKARLVDVAWLLDNHVVTPYARPTRPRPGIRMYVPGGRGTVKPYASRKKPGALLTQEGVFVLHGVPGSGKSTLARAAAVDAKGWFLDASSRQALIDSLARAELAERDERVEGLTDQAREGYAFAALARLREAADRWLVVLDNADGTPASLRGLLPQPDDPGQLVVITTTNADWEAALDVTSFKSLEPLTSEEVAELGYPQLVPLVAGRPLLLEAFRALIAASGARLPELELPTDDRLDDPSAGPTAFWMAVKAVAAQDDPTLLLCAIAAQLPPDYQPVSLLAELSDAGASVVELVKRGLLTGDEASPTVRLHRLFGASIRDDLERQALGLLEEAALRVSESDESRALLDRRGDPATTHDLAHRLTTIDDTRGEPDERLGVALHHLAWVLELKGDTPGSGALYERAERHLLDERDEIVAFRADCLHGRARTVNQKHAQNEQLLQAALVWARRSSELLISIGREDRIGRPLAMQGLLLQKTAAFAATREERLAILKEALGLLIDADTRRRAILAEDDPERARSTFNLAGAHIDLAKLEHDQAAMHLDEAERVYTAVRSFRADVYERDEHPHIAACDNGLALVYYYRAVLLRSTAPDRTEWLRRATRHARDALVQRETFDGPEDLTDTQKTTRLLAKIAIARWSLPFRAQSTLEPLHRELVGELTGSDLLVASVPPLTSAVDPVAHVQEWVASRALAQLIEWFGGTAPDPDAPPATSLAAVEEFSRIWDWRGDGRERNQILQPTFSGYDEMAVAAACRALGLDDMSDPPRTEYDHILVLGGLARGCLARPLAAARLLEEGKVSAASVVALGGFRELNGKERSLLQQLDVEGADCEIDVVDLGMRRAFAAQPEPEVRGGGELEHERWEIRTYARDGQPTLNVVAAPALSSTQRATTATTCAWLANEGEMLRRGQSLLIVTTHHYRSFQLADAIRELGRTLDLTVDAYGMSPGKYDYRLAYTPDTAEYLQEVRSTIRSYGSLFASLTS